MVKGGVERDVCVGWVCCLILFSVKIYYHSAELWEGEDQPQGWILDTFTGERGFNVRRATLANNAITISPLDNCNSC